MLQLFRQQKAMFLGLIQANFSSPEKGRSIDRKQEDKEIIQAHARDAFMELRGEITLEKLALSKAKIDTTSKPKDIEFLQVALMAL